jgi:tetratricopeptide (TPR) repeat protein
MTIALTRARRMAVAAAALALATCLFRSQVASALVVRGDDFLYRNDAPAAQTRYERALALNGSDATAIDRIAFLGMQQRTRRSLRRAVAVASSYLTSHPNDAVILADRGLCYLIARDYALARPDFERAAAILRDPRYFTFAGWAAWRAHDPQRARRLWADALSIDNKFSPARAALERSL